MSAELFVRPESSAAEESLPDSTVWWYNKLEAGDPHAAAAIWDRYFKSLVEFAQRRLNNRQKRVEDGDDLASKVLMALIEAANNNKLPKLDSSEDIWRMLLAWMNHDLIDHVRSLNRAKRGGGRVRGDSVFARLNKGPQGFDQIASGEASIQAVCELEEAWEVFCESLQDPTLSLIARRLIEGRTREEIAEELNKCKRTIARKIELIRNIWRERTLQ